MGMFFTWRSSDHSCHLDVKWKPQDEILGADNAVERRKCRLPRCHSESYVLHVMTYIDQGSLLPQSRLY